MFTSTSSGISQILQSITQHEHWKVISDYPAYSVSTKGNVKINKSDRIMRPQDQNSGYLALNLTNETGVKRVLVHRLIAQAFIPNPDNLPQVNHKDGDKTNNASWNLEWNTASDNIKHAYGLGLMTQKGEANNGAKLTVSDVNYIRGEGFKLPTKTLTKMFDVSPRTIWRVKNIPTYFSTATTAPTYE